ncbi:hypothetical protein [Providencia sp. PROV124]|uniref:hypothetical protein n=1 Tax=Providencia sp. PROV124 TaxID=2949835 RepID=UPI00234A2D18|nr:hypothetical protein [Providencia sp. PROV124]
MSLVIYIVISLCVAFWVWKKKEHFSLNSDSLQKQWLFRLAIFFPLMSSLYFMFWLGSSYPFRWDAIGYNSFLDINKFSLGILALSPILGAFVVYAHRSIQMAKQIELTEKKNKVDLYFSERKNINELLSSVKTLNGEEIIQTNLLYMKAFDLKNNYNDTENTDFYEYLNESISLISHKFLIIRDDITDVENFKTGNMGVGFNQFPINIEIIRISNLINTIKEYLNFKINKDLDLVSKCSQFLTDKREDIQEDNSNFFNVMYTFMVASEVYSFLNSIKEVVLILSSDKNIDCILPNFTEALCSFSLGSFSIGLVDDGDKLAAENQNPPE